MPKRKADITIRRLDGSAEVVKANHFAKHAAKLRHWHYARLRRMPYWRGIRRQALARDGHRCVECGAMERLEVHHRTYERLGRELLGDLVTLCQPCRATEHQWQRKKVG